MGGTWKAPCLRLAGLPTEIFTVRIPRVYCILSVRVGFCRIYASEIKQSVQQYRFGATGPPKLQTHPPATIHRPNSYIQHSEQYVSVSPLHVLIDPRNARRRLVQPHCLPNHTGSRIVLVGFLGIPAIVMYPLKSIIFIFGREVVRAVGSRSAGSTPTSRSCTTATGGMLGRRNLEVADSPPHARMASVSRSCACPRVHGARPPCLLRIPRRLPLVHEARLWVTVGVRASGTPLQPRWLQVGL